jgi:hypothetical protein
MIKTLILILIINGGFIINGLAQQSDINPNIKNESGIKLKSKDSPHRMTDVIGGTYCYGEVDTCLDILNSIGISKSRMRKSVQCTVGDFDANGYLDFVIWGMDTTKKYQYDIEWTDAENYLVLFFEKSRVIRTIKIKTVPGYYLVFYKQRVKVGPNGEPITDKDALWICGETDDYYDETKGTVYVFDSKLEDFKTIKFGKK